MFNVLKMDLFRLRKSKYAYIILLVLSLLFLFGTILDSSQKKETSEIAEQENKNSFELYTENYDTTYTGQFVNKYEMLVSAFSGNVVPMSILIFSGLFAGAYHKNRFEKNIKGLIGGEQNLLISNLIICSIYCFIIIFVTLLISLIGYYLFYPNFASMPSGSLKELIKYIISYYILLHSVAIIMSCFVQIVGNQIIAIIIGLIYGSGIVYGIIDFVGQTIGLEGFSIQEYVPLGNLYNLSIHNQNAYLRAIIIAIIFSMVFVIMNVMVKNRQDIVT